MSKKRKLTLLIIFLLAALCIAAALLIYFQKNKADGFSGVMLDGEATLEMMLSGDFTVTNGVGQRFTRENGEFGGDMECFSMEHMNADAPNPANILIEVPACSAYRYEPVGERFGFQLMDEWTGFLSVSGENLAQLTISDNQAILKGNRMVYHLAFSAVSSSKLIFLDGEDDQVRFFWEDGKLYTDGVSGTVTGKIQELYASSDSDPEFTMTVDFVIDPSNQTEPVTPQ